jgi:hypothetical protein
MNTLSPEDRANFERWMVELDAEHAKRGSPYGAGSFWQLTGAECWHAFFEDGMPVSEALDQDMAASQD